MRGSRSSLDNGELAPEPTGVVTAAIVDGLDKSRPIRV